MRSDDRNLRLRVTQRDEPDLAKLIEGEFAHAPRVRDDRDRSLLRARLPEAFARLLAPLL